jgi:hypothetical protein
MFQVKFDTAHANLLAPTVTMTKDQKANYKSLLGQLSAYQSGISSCPGDGNLDRVVHAKDPADHQTFANTAECNHALWSGTCGQSSLYQAFMMLNISF